VDTLIATAAFQGGIAAFSLENSPIAVTASTVTYFLAVSLVDDAQIGRHPLPLLKDETYATVSGVTR